MTTGRINQVAISSKLYNNKLSESVRHGPCSPLCRRPRTHALLTAAAASALWLVAGRGEQGTVVIIISLVLFSWGYAQRRAHHRPLDAASLLNLSLSTETLSLSLG